MNGSRGRSPSSSRTSSSNDASAASYDQPLGLALLDPLDDLPTDVRAAGHVEAELAALELDRARPAISVTRMRWSLPTTAGSRWLYSSGPTLIADACRPALWANADAPT